MPGWSPDGTRLAVAVFPRTGGQRELWVIDADGSDPHLVASADNVSAPSWSPDGSTIAYVAATPQGSAIHFVSPDGSADRTVGEVIPPGQHSYFTVSFSPDGRQLLFDKGTDSGFGISVMDTDGTDMPASIERDKRLQPLLVPGRTIDRVYTPRGVHGVRHIHHGRGWD